MSGCVDELNMIYPAGDTTLRLTLHHSLRECGVQVFECCDGADEFKFDVFGDGADVVYVLKNSLQERYPMGFHDGPSLLVWDIFCMLNKRGGL
jgi:uncharacterized protein YfeS